MVNHGIHDSPHPRMTNLYLHRALRLAPSILLALAGILALLYIVLEFPLRSARAAWRRGAHEDALQGLDEWGRPRLRGGDFDNLRAVVHLTSGKRAQARPYLDRLSRSGEDSSPVLRKDEVGSRLVGAGLYQEFLMYDNAYKHRGESQDAVLFRSAAQLGAGKVREADASFLSIDATRANPGKYAALRSAVDERKKGSFALVLDRTGKTIATYQIANADLVAINDDFTALIDQSAGPLSIEAQLPRLGTANTILTTLDPVIQKIAVDSLGGLRGSLVVIDIPSNELLAVASTPGRGPLRNLAFEGDYEPGSVVKVLTALNAFDSGIDPAKLFPLDCGGFLVLNRRQFFDWARHRRVVDLSEAMAVSCNVAFGRLGLRLGASRLRKFMQTAGFGETADLGILTVPLGRNVGELNNDYATASYAVGLEKESLNALHVAMLAGMVARDGRLAAPRLVRGRHSILGEPVGKFPPAPERTVATVDAVRRITPMLRAVVEHARGTGRRSAISGVPIAMKTGTAGDGSNGYDAVILAFAPADAPKIAIGLIAEEAGPAEFAGAQIARDFFMKALGTRQ